MTAFVLKSVSCIRPAKGRLDPPDVPRAITKWIAERDSPEIEVGQTVVAEFYRPDDPDILGLAATVVSISDHTLSVMFAMTFADEIAVTLDGEKGAD